MLGGNSSFHKLPIDHLGHRVDMCPTTLYDLDQHQIKFTNQDKLQISTHHVDSEAFYASDEFRMYTFKIKRCPIARSHDWTECPYAHRGERAQRRDPRKFKYLAITCPDFRRGNCVKGNLCERAHGIFEYWLHPAKYRTRACNAGQLCRRKVCFFAHSMEELRPEMKLPAKFFHKKGCPSNGMEGTPSSGMKVNSLRLGEVGFNDLLMQLEGFNLKEGDGELQRNVIGFDGLEGKTSDLSWIAELLLGD